jgi:hypothetical protein
LTSNTPFGSTDPFGPVVAVIVSISSFAKADTPSTDWEMTKTPIQANAIRRGILRGVNILPLLKLSILGRCDTTHIRQFLKANHGLTYLLPFVKLFLPLSSIIS